MSKLNEKEIALFKGKNFAFVATINPDGTPQVTPVWIDTDGRNILVNTQLGRVKPRNVARDKRVAVSVYDQENPYSRVSVNGRVVKEITGNKAGDHIDFLSVKYTGKKYKDRVSVGKRVMFVVAPERVTSHFE